LNIFVIHWLNYGEKIKKLPCRAACGGCVGLVFVSEQLFSDFLAVFQV